MDNFDDDFMLNNIVTTNNKSLTSTLKKADLKKQKYATKIKQQRKRTIQKPNSFFQTQTNNSIQQLFTSNQPSQIKKTSKTKKQTQNSFKKTYQTQNYLDSPNQNANHQSQNQKHQIQFHQNETQSKKHQSQNKKHQIYNKKLGMQIKSSRRQSQQKFKKVFLQKKNPVLGTIDLKSSRAKMQEVNEILPEKDLSRLQKLDQAPIEQLNLNKSLFDSLKQNNISKLTKIQTISYTDLFERRDSIIKAATGSGKTLAYLIPLINQLVELKHCIKRQQGSTILVICPTRELCIQAQKQAMRCLKRLPFLVTGCLVGGQQTNHEKSRIRKGIPLLFSTPGRLLYHLQNTQSFKLDSLKNIVFEQADRTLDMGFERTLNEILQLVGNKADMNKIQKVLVSAHFNEKVEGLIKNLAMKDAHYIGFQSKNIRCRLSEEKDQKEKKLIQVQAQENAVTFLPEHEQEINISANLKQQYVLIAEEQKVPFSISYISVLPHSKIMIFVSTIAQVEYIDYLLNNIVYRNSNGEMTSEKIQKRRVFKLHGDLDQKLRTNTYFQFRKQKYAIMISTEVAARGLDFPDLSHILLFDVPPTITDYGNRIGRSARFNSAGVSLLLLHYQQSDFAEKIRYYNKKKPLENIDKDVVYDNFQQYLKKLKIRDNPLHYIQGIVRSMVKDDDQKYNLARKAYVSMLRAYARLKEKHIFHVKKLNLKLLSRSFGLNSAQAEARYNPMAKESHFQTIRKKRKVESVKKLQVSEYL